MAHLQLGIERGGQATSGQGWPSVPVEGKEERSRGVGRGDGEGSAREMAYLVEGMPCMGRCSPLRCANSQRGTLSQRFRRSPHTPARSSAVSIQSVQICAEWEVML